MENDWDLSAHKKLYQDYPASIREANQELFDSLGITKEDLLHVLCMASVSGPCRVISDVDNPPLIEVDTYRLGNVYYTKSIAYLDLPSGEFLEVPYSI